MINDFVGLLVLDRLVHVDLIYPRLSFASTCWPAQVGIIRKLKVYRNPLGQCKGDCLVIYDKPESVHGAVIELNTKARPQSIRPQILKLRILQSRILHPLHPRILPHPSPRNPSPVTVPCLLQ